MGILNVTPDSFSDGGCYASTQPAVEQGRQLVADGAMIVDVGGESTRPGATPVDVDEELDRVIPVVEQLVADGAAIVSIDTRKPAVARAAIEAGAHLVNDVGGLRDEAMIACCADAGVPAVIMHMLGEPSTMQADPHYDAVVTDVVEWLHERADAALAAGVPSVIVDPGIGFGKALDHNVALLRALPLTERYPVIVGASRKRSVRTMAGVDDPRDSDMASAAVHLWAAQRGAALVRVHDVAGHRQAFAVDRILRDG